MNSNKFEIPEESHPIWEQIATGATKIDFDFMATKILLIRIQVDLSAAKTPQLIKDSITELRQMFLKNIRNPRVQNDTRKLLGGRAL